MSTKIVTIKVGAQLFTIDLEILQNFPDSTLSKTVLFNISQGKEDQIVDYAFRDPTLFPVVMSFYRNGKLKVPEGVTYAELQQELDFWGFNCLSSRHLFNSLTATTCPKRILPLCVRGACAPKSLHHVYGCLWHVLFGKV